MLKSPTEINLYVFRFSWLGNITRIHDINKVILYIIKFVDTVHDDI